MNWLLQHRFQVLLVAILGLLVAIPLMLDFVAAVQPTVARTALFIMTSLSLLAGTLGVSDHKATRLVALCLLIPVLGIAGTGQFMELGKWIAAPHLLRAGLMGFVIAVLMRYLFRSGIVTFDTICASLCVYLLMGILWENLYSAVDILCPGSLTSTVHAAYTYGANNDMHRSLELLYFSYVTLATLGYGDIVPITATARMLAVTEALTGQGYLLIMVSRMVSMYGSHPFAPPVDTTKVPDGDRVELAVEDE